MSVEHVVSPSSERGSSDRIRIFGLELSTAVFDRVAKLAESMFPASGASIILIHEGQVWRSAYASELPDEDPITEGVVASGQPFWVADGHADPRFSNHPLVVGPPFLRFCATTPIQLGDGSRPGVLSVSSRRPQPFDAAKAERLADLAALVGQEWSHAQTVRALEQSMRERDAALLASERSEERLNLALALSGLHVFEIDYQRRVLIKAGAEDTFFSEPQTYADVYRDIYATIHPDDRAAVAAAWKAHTETGAPYRPEYRIHRRDGREVWAQGSIKFFTTPEGRPARMVGALQDITARKQAERALLQATEDAKGANRAKSAFLATMSHEIRTPLNGILGMAQAIAADELTPAQRERLDIVRQSGETLLAILNDVLDLSKIEAAKFELEAAEFEINDLARGAYAAFTAIANKKGLSFDLKIEPRAAGVYLGDSTRIRQILYNLVSNAVKFTDRGEVRVRVDRLNGDLQISVSDTGIGIAAEPLSRLFDKFEQADSTTSRRYGGTGLGLAICRELAALMGGTIRAESREGQGATFTVTLPLPRVAASRPALPLAPPEPAPSAPQATLKVLAAEDNEINRLVLQTLLQQVGVVPTIVDDGAAAVAAWSAEHWDIVLMDVQMPNMDGPTACRMIRQIEAASGRPRTPIVALTANAMTHQAAEYFDAGMDGIVPKPIELGVLFSAMEEALEAAPAKAP